LLRIQAPYWLQFNDERVYSAPANEPVLLGARQGGWGFISSGWFQFAPDEALVVTIDPLSAAYVGFQVTDGWTIPPDYIRHLAGLNKAQAKPNADGTYTFVVASRDPGVWNWVDTVGLQTGAFTIRWQRVADRNADPVAAIRASQVVKLGALDSVLPPGAVRVDAAGRAKQIEARIASFALRREN
jgi:hypothetical protein